MWLQYLAYKRAQQQQQQQLATPFVIRVSESDFDNQTSYVDVKDVARAIHAILLSRDTIKNEVFNIGMVYLSINLSRLNGTIAFVVQQKRLRASAFFQRI